MGICVSPIKVHIAYSLDYIMETAHELTVSILCLVFMLAAFLSDVRDVFC